MVNKMAAIDRGLSMFLRVACQSALFEYLRLFDGRVFLGDLL